ncbi:hypothetical protein EDB86DRAFT_3093001 [Lactarius hatsudake]|nr:hypothetical protein EDB86DRAFT_3093001 [Lactarius hatsudake]
MPGGSSATTDQCALRSDGTLKDASEIPWYGDKDDDMPMAPPVIVQPRIEQKKRKRNTAWMEEIIRAEQESDESDTQPHQKKKKRRKHKPEVLSDPEDKPYTTVASGFDSESDSSSITEIAPDEIADMLPSKMKPPKSRKSSKGKGRAKASLDKPSAAKQHQEIADGPPDGGLLRAQPLQGSSSTNSLEGSSLSQKKGVKRNLIYLFYEATDLGADGSLGRPGDKHFRCCHGNKKVLTITKAMNHNLNGLVGHLRTHFKLLFSLYMVLKDRETLPTEDEKAFASSDKEFTGQDQAEYVKALETRASTIASAFLRQQQAAVEPFDSSKFECLLTEWIVACDQPLDEVEKPEFIRMIQGIRYDVYRAKSVGSEEHEPVKTQFGDAQVSLGFPGTEDNSRKAELKCKGERRRRLKRKGESRVIREAKTMWYYTRSQVYRTS